MTIQYLKLYFWSTLMLGQCFPNTTGFKLVVNSAVRYERTYSSINTGCQSLSRCCQRGNSIKPIMPCSDNIQEYKYLVPKKGVIHKSSFWFWVNNNSRFIHPQLQLYLAFYLFPTDHQKQCKAQWIVIADKVTRKEWTSYMDLTYGMEQVKKLLFWQWNHSVPASMKLHQTNVSLRAQNGITENAKRPLRPRRKR